MTYGFIGYGNMGSAIITGIINKQDGAAQNILVTRKNLDNFPPDAKFNISSTISELIEKSDIIFLCTKPQQYEEILRMHDLKGKTIVSIGAGITSDLLKKYTTDYVLTMPNTAARINQSITPIVQSDSRHFTEICNLFTDLGSTIIIKEEELTSYIALLGSSPAYFYYFIEALAKNFPTIQNSEYYLAKIMQSTSSMLLNSDLSARQLKENVCSPNGCTVEAINSLEQNNFELIIVEALTNLMIKAEAMKLT